MDNIQNFKRSHYCGDLRVTDAGKTVSVCGWVQRQRDLGGLIFVDLRDRTGLVQLSFDDSTDTQESILIMRQFQWRGLPLCRKRVGSMGTRFRSAEKYIPHFSS